MSKDKFFKVYSNLPEDIRREIIIVIEDKPYTWDAAYIEVKKDTALGAKILEKMSELEFI